MTDDVRQLVRDVTLREEINDAGGAPAMLDEPVRVNWWQHSVGPGAVAMVWRNEWKERCNDNPPRR